MSAFLSHVDNSHPKCDSECFQTALFAAIVNRAVYGSDKITPKVNGSYVENSPLWNFLQGSVPYNGKQYLLQQLVSNDHLAPWVTEALIEFMGRLFGCKASGFPSFSSNPDFTNSSYQYPNINAIRNIINGLNLQKSFYDSINNSIIQSMKSLGVSDDDINSIVIPTIEGFENGLIGQPIRQPQNNQQSKVTQISDSTANSAMKNSLNILSIIAGTILGILLL